MFYFLESFTSTISVPVYLLCHKINDIFLVTELPSISRVSCGILNDCIVDPIMNEFEQVVRDLPGASIQSFRLVDGVYVPYQTYHAPLSVRERSTSISSPKQYAIAEPDEVFEHPISPAYTTHHPATTGHTPCHSIASRCIQALSRLSPSFTSKEPSTISNNSAGNPSRFPFILPMCPNVKTETNTSRTGGKLVQSQLKCRMQVFIAVSLDVQPSFYIIFLCYCAIISLVLCSATTAIGCLIDCLLLLICKFCFLTLGRGGDM